ncbi:hypothetical protein I545_2595 [Mycobacterium kansasii 662]|uniref:Uncharacterized protein n=2 Tax=Mycobacterium kansasii TaxID=1768 RepID=A0A1V3WYI3_MYCKA|nr:hypothetical protein I547_4521 [Mycobacterium kansasii 824]EUA18748.1 hypothetical protein I545_2595 [Mycobacterium kansasii 662]KEP40522.1 hypothetical protein MKSMC1_43490 [Mycobacterium kansasii]OOK72044.1 hypothetical protein BZL30_5402 [Mycobacterium kansasii]
MVLDSVVVAVLVVTVVEVELEADARGGACCCDPHATIPGQLSARTSSNLTIGIGFLRCSSCGRVYG